MKQKTISLNPSSSVPYKLNKIFVEVIVAILLIVWFHTSISKLADFEGLRIQMSQSVVFRRIPMLAAIVGPSLEIIAAVLLIFKRTRLVGMIGSFLLMLFFTWYVSYLMIVMPTLPCSCGGVVRFLTWPQHLAFNIFLTIISFAGILMLRRLSKV